MKITDSVTLPCGSTLPHRIAKSAMSENMAAKNNYPGENFCNTYSQWAKGGLGLCITGNVMIDSGHLGEPHNVVIEKGLDNEEGLKAWAESSKSTDMKIWVQLNHPGKQTPNFLTKTPVAPSAVPLAAPLNNAFNEPRELTEEEISEIIERFAYAAKVCKEAGFAGVQIHGAHGYLVSQFLSPHHNQRSDKWGGSIENRILFASEIYKAIRMEVGDDFPIGIKLNSADFSKGGFTHEEAIFVAKSLSDLGMDLIEISGGSYEKPVMTGVPIKESTKKREAYFLEYAKDIKAAIKCPLMVTGGFRSSTFMHEALEQNELDIIGLARPLCINPNFPNQILSGEDVKCETRSLTSGIKLLDTLVPLEIVWYTMQIQEMGKNRAPNPNAGVYTAILKTIADTGITTLKRVRVK